MEGWHRLAKEVLLSDGICTCITTQSNNLLQYIIDVEQVDYEKLGQFIQE